VSIRIKRYQDVPLEELASLERAIVRFYNNPPYSYYEIADRATGRYTHYDQPFHCELISRITSGMSVLELGCGTAHLCQYIHQRGGTYTGIDYSTELLNKNRERFPTARFFPIGSNVDEEFDMVVSFYTLEHVLHPISYLQRLWDFCRPGGCIAIACPEFIDSTSLPPSIYYGRTARRLRMKFRRLNVSDVLEHLLDLGLRAPRWKTEAIASPPGAFWINLRPRILCDVDYSIDADAVHLTRLKDILWFLNNLQADILVTSQSMAGVSPEVLRYNCYVVARKGT